MQNKYLSYSLVIAQFCLIAALVMYGGITGSTGGWLLTIAALLLGIWAVATMKFKVSVLPDVRGEQQLITSGPYRFIRHPMYTAVLTLCLAAVYNRLNPVTVLLWVELLIVLMIKLRYEERQLVQKFKPYKQYMHRTKRLLPLVW